MANSIYALLIGCDFYFPNETEDETIFRSLKGCVRDITRIEEELLKGRLQVPPENILKLKSSNIGAGSPPEPESEQPTYENIIEKFQQITEMAKSGDQVYIHYSGHGGRASTNFPNLKGNDGVDETLVPINIEDVSTRYVRDLELAKIFQSMVDKGLLVTAVLDSCHSGGMTRGNSNPNDTMVRGCEKIDKRKRPTESLVADSDELIRVWREAELATRGVESASGWLPEPQGYVLLAACLQNELATEFKFNGIDRCGALTYWLLDVLKQTGSNASWKQVYDRLLAKITSQFTQTPQLQGETERQIFGLTALPQNYAVNVLQYDAARNRLQLNTGEALGTAKGAFFAVYPSGTSDFTQSENRLGVAQVEEVDATKLWAKITEQTPEAQFQQGDQAVLIDNGLTSTQGRVNLVEDVSADGTDLVPTRAERDQSLAAVKDAITAKGRGFLTTAETADASNYQVAIEENGEFSILDPFGKPFPNLHPAIKINEGNATENLITRLVHLTKFHTIQYLKSPETLSPLTGKIMIEAFAAPADAKNDQPPTDKQPLPVVHGIPTVKHGDRIYLNIRNEWNKSVNIAVLMLDVDWSIVQALPTSNLGQTLVLEPGQSKSIWRAPKAFLLPGYNEGINIFKVFAATGDASFRYLELPPLDNPFRSVVTRATLNPLEELLADSNADQPASRGFEFVAEVSKEWTVIELAVKIVRV